MLATIPEGGTAGAAIYWLFAFPPASFLLNGLRRGLFFNTVFLLGTIALYMLWQYGVVDVFYTNGEFIQFWIAFGVIVWMSVVSEITAQKFRTVITSRSEELRVLLANLPVGVVMIQAKTGQPVASNAAMEKLFGKPIPYDVTVADFPKTFDLALENCAPFPSDRLPCLLSMKDAAPHVASNVFVTRPDGSRIVLRVSASPVIGKDGRVSRTVAVYDDMTREYEVDKMKSEFTSFVSHQLKVPLANMRWSLNALRGGDSGALTAEQDEQVRHVETVTGQLATLVTDLLTVSHLENAEYGGRLALRRTDVLPILDAAIRDAALSAKEHRVRIESRGLPESLQRRVDGVKIRQVFANIIGNAVKYSRAGGTVTVSFAQETPFGPALSIKDEGIGIPKAAQKKVFERFFRAENTGDVEWNGLGLYIAKQMVESLGGRLWFDSEEGKGTTFYIALPEAAS